MADRRSGLVAGLDVGGTKTLAVAVDPAVLDAAAGTPWPEVPGAVDGATVGDAVATGVAGIVATVRHPTGEGGGDHLLRSTTDALAALAEAAGTTVDGFAAVGVGVPGLVDRSAGTVPHAVDLGFDDTRVPLAERPEAVARARVVVDNDVDLAAVGAAAALGCRGDLAYLSIGTGPAAGLVLDGRIRPGAHGAAGEIGRLPIDPQGPRCECGQRGCLEAVASGTAIAARWPSPDGPLTAASSLPTAAAAGDAAAQALLAEVAGHLAGAVALPAQTVEPEIVVLGGGVADAGPGLLTAVQQALRARAALSPVLAAIHLAERVALVPRGVRAGAVGAAVLARRQLVERATPAEPQVAGPSAVESDTT